MGDEFLTVAQARTSPAHAPIEIVERKGTGHPDTLADGIAEAVSIEYSKHCLRNYGAVLHHNVDKIAIGGGRFKSTEFGIAEMIAPVNVVLNGRMSSEFGGKHIDVGAIQEAATRQYLARVLPELDVHAHLRFVHLTTDHARYDTWFRPRGLDDLPELVRKAAADASIAIGYWPLTPTEQLTLTLERHLTPIHKPPRYPFLGQDIKLLSYRRGMALEITMSIPFLSRVTPDEDFYFQKKAEVYDDLLEVARATVGNGFDIALDINTQERAPFKHKRIYMLALGSCIDCGEEGVVGRGNPPIGVISVFRSHSVEAPYGKNPVYHSGKVYTYLASRLARAISEAFECEVTVYAISKNGHTLLPPAELLIETGSRTLDKQQIMPLIEEHFLYADYLTDIIDNGALLPA